MVADFGSLWMLVRSRLELTRLPAADEALTVRTWLRSPTPVMSVRDYDFCADGEVIGSAVHCWVLVNAEARHMIDLRQIPALWELPVHVPERKTRLRRLTLPETMTAAGAVRVTDAEIDDNGHMNNVAYVRRAHEAAPGLFRGLEVVYDRECFRGALLTLEHAADADAQYVRGVLESGEESFRMRFFGAEAAQ